MIETAEAKQVTAAASSLLFPEIDFGVASNATYTREGFEPVLSRIAFDNGFANAGAKAYQCARGDEVSLETNDVIRLLGHFCTIYVTSTLGNRNVLPESR